MAFNFDVVISGISGRFPECDDIDTFKKKLYDGDSSDFLTTDERKWKNGFKLHRYHEKRAIPQTTGKYIQENDFDFRAFKFNQLVAKSTDVLNHICLEVGFEAIVDAGINPVSLSGANIGVFIATGVAERDINCLENAVGYVFVLGCSRTMGPNRLSYSLNLTGPSFGSTCDPFGSMELLKLAKGMIQDGKIEGAIVVAANNLTQPVSSYLFECLNLLTSEEFCRPFDEHANGFVRSESSVALFLQREEDAKRIYAKFKFCDTLYDGLLPHTLLGYDEEYLRNSLQTIYERNGGDAIAKDLAFLELSGSAIKKFDNIEANAVADVLFKWRKNSLLVGSIKSLVGHTESSSQLLSILKVIFALDSEIIPPNKNISKPDENIRAFKEQKFQVVDKKTELLGNMAAVNSLGLFGAVNHVVLEKHFKETNDTEKDSHLPRLLLISGRSADGLKAVFKKIQFDSYNVNVISMTNDVFCTNMPLHTFRGFLIRTKEKTLSEAIEERGDEKRPVCFVFSGMGSQWNGMGKELLNLPVFADVIKRCDAVLRPKSINIYDVILSDDPSMFDNITMSFVSIICMQIALVEVLKELGIKPDTILGHSVGENGCAYADGCVTLEQAVLISYSRGTASNTTKLVKGMMAAIGKGYSEIKDSLPESIEVACHNSASSCTISGPAKDVEDYVEQLKEQDIFARAVNVSNIAYHSRYIAPAGPKLRELLQPIIPNPKKRSSKWISSSVPEEQWNSPLAETCSSEYLTNNLLCPVLFEEACKHIPKNAIVVEIAPHGLLQAILKRALPDSCTNISLTRRSTEQNNLHTLLASIGRLYIAGCEPLVNNLYPPVQYPVPRGTPSISPYCTWFHGDCDIIKPHFKRYNPIPLSRENIIVRMNEDSEFSFLKHHQINGEAVIPTSFFLYLVWRMLSVHKNVEMDDLPILFEKVLVHRNVKLSLSKPRVINILIQGSGSFEVLSRSKTMKKNSKVVLTGRVEFVVDEKEIPKSTFPPDEEKFEFAQKNPNKILRYAGYQLGECFQSLMSLHFGDTGSTANIRWHGNWVTLLDAALKFQMFSDIQESNLCYLHSARRIFINPSVIKTVPHGSIICCYNTKSTNMFQCNGIEMHDVKWKIKARKLVEYTSSSKTRKLKCASYNNPKCQNKVLETKFSGVNEADEKIMGLTSTNVSHAISKMDPILTWLVPDEWKSIEANGVPVNYAHVYMLMRVIENSLHWPSPSIVIITDSKNISARSLINLCLIKNLNIYIVTPDEDNVTDFQSEFSSLNKLNFIIPVNDDFDHIILFKTKGKGANVIVNFLPGSKNTISSMNSVSVMSQVVETVESNLNEDTEFGLFPFTNTCSFLIIPCKITYFLDLPDNDKIYLQNAIKEGILSGFVKPLTLKSNSVALEKGDKWSIDDKLSTQWNSKSQISNGDIKSSPKSLKFAANRSYIIIGGEHGEGSCMNITHWLTEKNASNVVIIGQFGSNSKISSQINSLLTTKKITISLKSLNKLNSVDDAVQLIDETKKLATLDSVFFVCMKSCSKIMNYMETATNICTENVKFISLFAGGIEEMEARHNKGQPSFVLHSKRFPKNLHEVLNDFEKMLETSEPLNQNDSDQLSPSKLPLPKSIHHLERIGRNISEEVKFIEMTSKCIRWADCRGVYPVFVVPALHAFELESFFLSLMYPVFCANLTENSSIYETASTLYQHLITIHKIGPVTLIGETWNSAVAMELSSLIKEAGRDVKLFLFEGNPTDWKNTINNLNLTTPQRFEEVLTEIYGNEILEHLHSLDQAGIKDKQLVNSKINGHGEVNSAHVNRCLRLLKRQFMNINDYSLNNQMIENTFFFFKQVTQNISLVLSNSSDVIRIDEDSYDNFIRSPVIKKIVNKHAMFAWL